MIQADHDRLTTLLQRAAVGLDAQLPCSERIDFYFESLCDLSIEQVEAAMGRLVRISPHFPKPSDIRGVIEAAAVKDGRPGVEEAWGVAVKFANELATVTWTDEMAAAWGLCRELHATGDRVGARMAFKETYLRLVDEARGRGEPVRWCASLGWDAEERREPLLQARAHGRLTDYSTASQIAGSSRSNPAVPLLGLAQAPGVPEAAREALKALHVQFAERASAPSNDRTAKVQTAAAKREMADRVAAYIEVMEIGQRVATRMEGRVA